MPSGGFSEWKLPQRTRAVAALLLAATLAGCGSTLSNLPPEMGGLPADTPARPATQQYAYPAVHDMPPPRESTIMTPEQVQQQEAEMARLRDQQTKQPQDSKRR